MHDPRVAEHRTVAGRVVVQRRPECEHEVGLPDQLGSSGRREATEDTDVVWQATEEALRHQGRREQRIRELREADQLVARARSDSAAAGKHHDTICRLDPLDNLDEVRFGRFRWARRRRVDGRRTGRCGTMQDIVGKVDDERVAVLRQVEAGADVSGNRSA